MDLSNFLVNPITLALIVLGVVEFIKKLGVTGNKLMLIAMFVGIFFATLYKAREFYLPAQPYIDVAYTFVNDRFPAQTKATTRGNPIEMEDDFPK